MDQAYPPQPWIIRRDQQTCASARSHREAQDIIRQLQKLYPSSQFAAEYQGANVSHCGEGGQPL